MTDVENKNINSFNFYDKNNKSEILFRRFLSNWIDYFIIMAFLIAGNITLGIDLYKKYVALFVITIIFYFLVLESIFGFTIGKLVTRLRIVNSDSKPPGFFSSIIRNIAKIFENNPISFGGFLAAGVYLYSKNGQRIGDFFAQTYVIDAKKLKDREFKLNLEINHKDITDSQERFAFISLFFFIISYSLNVLILYFRDHPLLYSFCIPLFNVYFIGFISLIIHITLKIFKKSDNVYLSLIFSNLVIFIIYFSIFINERFV